MTTAPTYNVPQVPSAFPCPPGDIFNLPTKEEILNAFNKIAQIPSELKAFIVENVDNLTKEAREELEKIIEEISEFIEKLADILSPYWQKLSIRHWQKEAKDAFTELIQELHIYIPTKIMEIISKLIPFNFTVTILGIEINLLKIFTKEEQLRIKTQIAEDVDKFFAMVAEEFQGFKADFGVLCAEWKAKMTWQYIKTKIQELLTNGLHSIFGKLIDMFDEIWDLLGLPNLIDLFTLDVGALIEKAIASLRKKRDEIVEKVQNAVGEAREKLEEELARINAQILGVIEDISLFGFNVRKIIGGIIEESVLSLEEQIMEFKLALEDFKQNWQKKLLMEWVKIVKKFFDAIGLGKIFEFLTFTFCDLLKLIGFPFAINLSNATLPKPVHPEVIKDASLLALSGGLLKSNGSQTTFTPEGTGGNKYVLVDGERTSDFTENEDGTITLDTPAGEGKTVYAVATNKEFASPGQTQFSIPSDVSVNNLSVYVSGEIVEPEDYSINVLLRLVIFDTAPNRGLISIVST